jgi:hypothetical protein
VVAAWCCCPPLGSIKQLEPTAAPVDLTIAAKLMSWATLSIVSNITNYNNYYEFIPSEGVAKLWRLRPPGMQVWPVNNPRTYSVDDLIENSSRRAHLPRCVEASRRGHPVVDSR